MGAKKEIIQYAALPFLIEDGQPKVLLVTSRETKRWILPKGKPEKKLAPSAVAAAEAYEEAGVRGRIADTVFAAFSSTKGTGGRDTPSIVQVYLLEVDEVLAKWPEMKERQRRWASPDEAVRLMSDSGLIEVMAKFMAHHGGGSTADPRATVHQDG